METYVMLIWLTSKGPDLKIPVANCEIASQWYVAARAWAARSGVPPTEVGYLCGYRNTSVMVRVHR
jgi:hypothetical protein